VQVGDGNLLECFYKAKQNVSPQCRQAVADAGYEVSLAPTQPSASVQLSSNDLVNSLQGVESSATQLSAARLKQLVAQGVHDPSRTNRVNREPLSVQLASLAQFTIAVQFDFNSARIRPDSFKAIGLMADAMYHPYLQGYRFLIIGHTDGKGNREYNLKLSQQRADAIREALINPFGIAATRIEAVGFGEEQFLNRKNPEAAENRRVQLINVGR
jgi:outer membrane protein OmpA-like peptidoglycan-associated protein